MTRCDPCSLGSLENILMESFSVDAATLLAFECPWRLFSRAPCLFAPLHGKTLRSPLNAHQGTHDASSKRSSIMIAETKFSMLASGADLTTS